MKFSVAASYPWGRRIARKILLLKGVHLGWKSRLNREGVGYNAAMQGKIHPFPTVLVAVLLWLSVLAFYLSHLPINHTYDGMVYASYVETPTTPVYQLFHPHHLLYNPLGRYFYQWGIAHGAQWDGLLALQCFDVLVGAFGLVLAFHLMVRLTGDRLIALFTALGLSLTYSYWYFSTTPAVRILASVTPLFAWWVFVLTSRRAVWNGVATGVAHVLAVLGHQTNLLLAPAFLAGIWLKRSVPWREKVITSAAYLATLVVGAAGVYAFVGRFLLSRLTFEKWIWWVTSYFHVSQWGGHLHSGGLEQGQTGMTLAFLGKADSQDALGSTLTYGGARTLLTAALIFLLLLALPGLRGLMRRQGSALAIGVLWLAAFVPFFLWWEPWNIEFWVSSTIPFWVLLGLLLWQITRLDSVSGLWADPALAAARRWLLLLLAFSSVGLMGFYNYQGKIQKSPETFAHKNLLAALKAKVRVDDLVVVSGANTVPMYLDRYQKRKYLNVLRFLQKNRHEGLEGRESWDPSNVLDAQFRSVWKRHRKVFVLRELCDPQSQWTPQVEKINHLTEGFFRELWGCYPMREVSYQGNTYFYELGPKTEPTPSVEGPPTGSLKGRGKP